MIGIKRAITLTTKTLESPIAKSVGLELRLYQVRAAFRAFKQLIEGNSVSLALPTGTGKTLIANIVTLFWLTARPDSRILYLTPTRILVAQHKAFIRWLAPKYQAVSIRQKKIANPGRLEAELHSTSIVISTPEILANCVRAHRIPPEIVNTIGLVIVDEYDDFLVFEYDESGPNTRFSTAYDKLIQALPSNIPHLLMSATSPIEAVQKGNNSQDVRSFAQLVTESYHPTPIKVSDRLISQYIPTANVIAKAVEDSEVKILGEAIKTEISLCFNQMLKILEGEPDVDYVFTRLEGIVSRQIQWIRYQDFNGKHHNAYISPRLLMLCKRLRNQLNNYEFLFEDMFYGFQAEEQQTLWFYFDVDAEQIKRIYIDKTRLIDCREEFLEQSEVKEFWPKLNNKAEILKTLILHRIDDKGVIFTRKIRLADSITPILRDFDIPFAQIDSRLSDRKRDAELESFKYGKARILVITRSTGKRGLDLPQADYSIFYSPKAKENTVWQELSRIRSNIQRSKDSYFFFYHETSEEEKMVELAEQMRQSGREYYVYFHY